jgi:hypothetical protein
MKKILFYSIIVLAVIFSIPYVALCIIACLYIKIIGFVIIPLSSYVGRAAPLPKWFMRFSDWLEYLTGKSL